MIVGVERLVQDLKELGFDNVRKDQAAGVDYAVIPDFEIPAGSFSGRVIELAIPAPADYPRLPGASIHVKADPHLLPFGSTTERNIIESQRGAAWQYWSYSFRSKPANPTGELISQINEIFRRN
jgi:hypothetical protein